MLLKLYMYILKYLENDLKYLDDKSIVLKILYYFFVFLVIFFLIYFIFFLIPLFIFLILNSYLIFEDLVYFIFVTIKGFSLFNYISNFKLDIDNTTNTDGEDLLSYLNDFTEISLQERGYYFDLILSHPFEFFLYTSFSYIFIKIVTNNKIKTPGNLFKYNKFFKN